MSPEQSEEIINTYGAALAAGTDGGIARRVSLLPCSKARIKFAFYTYISESVKLGLFEKDTANNLITAYSAIDSFIEDTEANEINDIGRKMKVEEAHSIPNELRDKYFHFATTLVANMRLLQEIDEYIKELPSH